MITMRSHARFKPRRLQRRAQDANFRNLGHAAAAIRLTARRSIRRRQGPSAPGRAPHTRAGALRRSIVYQVDRERQRAVIGPAFSGVGRSATAHEFGGRYRRDRYPRRPFMGPALTTNQDRLPKHWRASIR
jgi:phage gpG-like protein